MDWIVRQHQKFIKSFVEYIEYLPKEKHLKLHKRHFWGSKNVETIDAGHLVFTSDEKLNRMKINYINMHTLEAYSIIYKQAWLQFELFSFLVKQNIKGSLFLTRRDTT